MFQFLTPLYRNFRERYQPLTGPPVRRQEACGICGEWEAAELAQADFWDLQQVDLVRCSSCRNIQLDPMLQPSVVEKGCLALYRLQHQNETTGSRRRGFYRAFRKGVAFGTSLRIRGIEPRRILEVGSGDGYFLKGVQFVFPNAECACLDIVKEILDATEKVHGFASYCSALESFKVADHEKFDLIIARDILEHVSEPGNAIRNLAGALNNLGLLYFITPNGLQDGWQLFSRSKKHNEVGELLINHVNYFDPTSLKSFLQSVGFEVLEFYIYDFKQFYRGAGWRLIEQHMARRSARRSAAEVLQTTPSLEVTFQEAIDANAVPRVYRLQSFRLFLMLYCWLKHMPKFRLSAEAGVGEEIFALARISR